MLVDDDPIVLNMLQTGLADHGYSVEVFDNPMNALEAYKKNTPDLVVVDMEMPEMKGYELNEKMLSEVYRPIIVLSSKTDQHNTSSAIDSGVVGYLIKPASAVELIPAIETALARFYENENKILQHFKGYQPEDNQTLQQLIDHLSYGVMMIDSEWKVQHINEAASNIVKNCDVLACVQGKLNVPDSQHKCSIYEIIDTAFIGHMPTQAALIPLTDGYQNIQVLCLAMGSTRPIENVMLLFLDPAPEKEINAELLSAMYGITCKEAAIVEALMQGLTLKEYSAKSGLSYDTVKSQRNSVFVKTNTNNQQSLIAALSPLLKTLS